jgi:hypothetical protein
MTSKIIDLADLDCIYLSYDEPKKEEFWVKIQNTVPWAQRVDGVKGSDAAHKAAANLSGTDFFVLIDGDNLPDSDFFNLQLEVSDDDRDAAFRWKARNYINGLMYGNGGMSVWSREFVNNMRTHEASDGTDRTAVEFCFEPKYYAMHNCYSTTYPNGSPYQAWRAGFREGVKMCLDKGRRPTLQEFDEAVQKRNFDNLCIWQTVGRDVENGIWAIAGARLGTTMTMIHDWDHRLVQDFDELKKIWKDCVENLDPEELVAREGQLLKSRLGMPIAELDADQSRFFKHHYTTGHRNVDMMTKEIDVIRRIEKW